MRLRAWWDLPGVPFHDQNQSETRGRGCKTETRLQRWPDDTESRFALTRSHTCLNNLSSHMSGAVIERELSTGLGCWARGKHPGVFPAHQTSSALLLVDLLVDLGDSSSVSANFFENRKRSRAFRLLITGTPSRHSRWLYVSSSMLTLGMKIFWTSATPFDTFPTGVGGAPAG